MRQEIWKIAMLGPAPPFRGGISQFALMLATEYQRRGYNVKMFNFIRQYPQILFPGDSQTTEFSSQPDLDIEPVFTPYLCGTWNRAVQEIRNFEPDVVIVSYFLPWFAPSYAWICKRLRGIKIICLAHNVDFHEKWPGADVLTKAFFKHCNRIVVLSGASFRDLQRKMPAAVSSRGLQAFHPIYDCYGEVAASDGNKQPGDPTLLFFGLIKEYKGLDVLLKAMKKAAGKVSGLRLIVAGEVYGNPAQYRKMIRELGLEDRVEAHFRYVTDLEIGGFFRSSHACVLPYKSATQSGVIATSYSFNVPVICSDVGGLSEYVLANETGLLVPPNDPDALARAIIRFFNEGLFQPMSANIPAFKERYSWQTLADMILEA
ncbi:MAG: glycosyltransferase family 4 protein [Candidatus Syntrophosphaera sp.]|nr:glycosyltransferase family 4 protein [Candidatus Syntrophosphaera sp.]